MLLHRAGLRRDHAFLMPEDVLLAVEIVSPGPRRTDRFAKPGEYAAAGIPAYWRIEQDPVRVYAYRLAARPGPSGERQYELVTTGDTVIEVDQPFPIKLPVAAITP